MREFSPQSLCHQELLIKELIRSKILIFFFIQGYKVILLFLIYYHIMFTEELEAQNNLRSISQATNYIVDWTERKSLAKYKRQREREAQGQEHLEVPHHPPEMKKRLEIKKEVSEKYDLRKCQKKLETINQISFPIVQENLFKSQEKYILPRIRYPQIKETPSPQLNKKQSAKSISTYRIFQQQFIKKKLQNMQRKHSYSQKDLHAKVVNIKPKYVTRNLNLKRSSKNSSDRKMNIIVNNNQIEEIKKIIFKNLKRYSVNNLHEEEKRWSQFDRH